MTNDEKPIESGISEFQNKRHSIGWTWAYLAIAVVAEILWASSLKMTERFSELWPSVFNLTVYAINLYCLATALKTLPVAVAYSMWTGLSGVGVALCAVIFFKESLGILQIFSIVLIVLGIIGLEAIQSEGLMNNDVDE